jgi:hypothetical protein
MDGTIIVRGNFTQPATAVAKTIVFRPGVNWINIVNYSTREQFYFQTGMPTGIRIDVNGAVTYTAADSFVVIDYTAPSNFITGPDATTACSAANPPVVSTGAAIAIGDVVRVVNDAALAGVAQFGVYGVDFFVSAINAGVSCTLTNADNAFAAAPTVAGTFGKIYKINISSRFYPANRIVTKMSQAGGVITVGTSAPHGLTVGQQVRFKLPSTVNAGYVALLDSNSSNNYASFTVASVITNATGAQYPSVAFTLTANGAGLAANMGYPTVADVAAGSQLPEMIPFGQDTAYSVSQNANILAGATVNQGFIGIRLKAGANEPAGDAAEVSFWKVGACFNSEEYA